MSLRPRAKSKLGLTADAAGKRRFVIIGLLLLLVFTGCNAKNPTGALVITQTPVTEKTSGNGDVLDQRYPAGSRVVLVMPSNSAKPRILSKGLVSAGAPVVCPSGECVYFAAKAEERGTWQIYAVKPNSGAPKQITFMEGGAMDPAIISTGEIVFSSPVPQSGATWSTTNPPALYVQAVEGKPRRLTYGPSAAMEPTVLRDGRILFVSARSAGAAPDVGLFTINNDGTEVTAFAVDHDGAPFIHRPRELLDGRVGFLSATSLSNAEMSVEAVRTARPFKSRENLLASSNCSSVEPDRSGSFLLCMDTHGIMGRSMQKNFAVFRVAPDAKALGQPLFDDPAWNEVEAISLTAYPKPIGHVTAIMAEKHHGTVLCMNAGFTRDGMQKPAKVRIFTYEKGLEKAIGEVALQADGSFMAQVPAEVPLGFQSVDSSGNTLQKSKPFVWVRPGENRSCIGCHEPYNRTIPNLRPIAAGLPPVVLQKGGS